VKNEEEEAITFYKRKLLSRKQQHTFSQILSLCIHNSLLVRESASASEVREIVTFVWLERTTLSHPAQFTSHIDKDQLQNLTLFHIMKYTIYASIRKTRDSITYLHK
jgi:hypothetical protein